MKQVNHLISSLTERERDVLRGISMGLSNAGIAEQLTLSPATVKWYSRQIYSKLQLDEHPDKRAAAAQIGRQIGLSGLEAPVPDLPADVTLFVGRAEEVAALCDLLRAPFPRLITIVGMGGSGKTRLALQVARELLFDFDGRVYFISLQNARVEDDVLRLIARAIGCATGGTSTLVTMIARHLSESQTLLVLDNTEHLVAAVASLVTLLEHAPDLRIVLTSRQAMQLNSESIFPLSGMAYPDDDAPENLLDFDAVRYFVTVAQQVNLRWQPTPEDLQTITRICRLVDGLPLALNLAARCLSSLSLSQIEAEVTAGNRRLQTDAPDILPRQRSIEAVLRWMSTRLTPSQHKIFVSLGLFDGDFSLEAAGAITGLPGQDLDSFIQPGIIEIERPGRFKLHPLVRRHALQKLKNGADYKKAVRCFVHYYVDLAVRLSEYLVRDNAALDRFEQEWAHLRVAWLYALAAEDWDSLRCLLKPLHFFAWRRCYFHDARVLYQAAHEKMDSADTRFAAIFPVYNIHMTLHLQPITERMLETLQAQLPLIDSSGQADSQAFARVVLSLIQRARGRFEAAYNTAQDGLRLYTAAGDTWGMVITYYQSGRALLRLNDVQGAIFHWQQCQHLNEQVGDDVIASLLFHRMAGVRWREGRSQQALALLRQAEITVRHTGDRDMVGGVAQLMSLVHFSRGEFKQAAYQREISLNYYQWVHEEWTTNYLLTQAVYTALFEGDIAQAQRIMEHIGADRQDACVATCADHLCFVLDGSLPKTHDLMNRIEDLQRNLRYLEVILTAALLVARLLEDQHYHYGIALAGSLSKAPSCPVWFLDIPVLATTLETASSQVDDREFQALWNAGLSPTSAEQIMLDVLQVPSGAIGGGAIYDPEQIVASVHEKLTVMNP